MIKGFAYIAWQIENNQWVTAHAASPRYIAQEAARLAQSTLNSQPSTNP